MLGNISASFDVTLQPQTDGEIWEYNKSVKQIFMHFKETYNGNGQTDIVACTKMVTLIKMCLNKANDKVSIG
jgi:hypothetical protein